jgi:hypothetical protein
MRRCLGFDVLVVAPSRRGRCCWVFLTLRGYLRFAFAARALPVGVLDFALAFAFCLCGAVGLVCSCLRWYPRIAFVLHASPLCGAAPTFLCRRKEK